MDEEVGSWNEIAKKGKDSIWELASYKVFRFSQRGSAS